MSEEGFDENTLEFGEEHFGSDREAMSLSSSNKQIDRLSELPDSLLIHILSFLSVKEAGITSVLSKRWEFLWAQLPTLEFRESFGNKVNTLNFVSWVNRTLHIRKSRYLEKFLVEFEYDECFASEVNAWIEFAVKNEVKELDLFANSNYYNGYYYELPHIIYSCSSLTRLDLNGCIMFSESTIEWQSLTSLSLQNVELNQHLLDEILSSCSVLKSLCLEECLGFTRLEVNSRCLEDLTIEESEDGPFLEISAPYLRDLTITVFPQERKWKLINISSVVSASINFFEFDCDFSVEVMGNAIEFLENFKHVKELWVARECFEVLSKMVANGWQLPQFRLQDLTLLSCSEYEHNISGIIGFLESSPNLETLLLEGYETREIIFNLDQAANDLDGDLLHLKKIRIKNLADSNGEPLLTLARVLLRRAPALEEMMIVIDVEDRSDYVNIAQTLLTYPRSSTKAEIYMVSHK